MDDPYVQMLRYAAAVPKALRFRVREPNGDESEYELESPFALIGRSPECDICLTEETVSYRHAYIQAIGNRLACIDLLSTTGTRWGGAEFHGWMSSEMTMEVGPYTIQVEGDLWEVDDSLKPPLEFRPSDEHRDEYGVLPKVQLKLLNTSNKGKSWPINRIVTLVGRDERCRITMVNDKISRVQCGLLLLPSGLWMIDMLGKGGVEVSGESHRCALLAEGTSLKIGPYRLAAHYPDHQKAPPPQAAESGSGDAHAGEFLTKQNKIFQTQAYHDTLIVIPRGDSQAFLYQEIHIEASRVMELITNRNFQNLVVDFGQVDHLGKLILEALMTFCRAAPGKSAICGANAETYAVLESHPISRVWPHYITRQEALQAVYLPD